MNDPEARGNSAGIPKCPLCSSVLLPGKGNPSGSTTGIGCIVMLLGLVLCVLGGPIGLLIGVPLILYGAIRGSKRERGLRCTGCKHFIFTN